MSKENVVLIKDRSGRTRMRKVHELIWLWRTAQLPDDLQFKDEGGTWRPLAELVEPIIQEQDRVRSMTKKDGPELRPRRGRGGWLWLCAIVVAVSIAAVPILHNLWATRRAAQAEKARIAQWERQERMKDFITARRVVIGMSADQVRRAWGEPGRTQPLDGADRECGGTENGQ